MFFKTCVNLYLLNDDDDDELCDVTCGSQTHHSFVQKNFLDSTRAVCVLHSFALFHGQPCNSFLIVSVSTLSPHFFSCSFSFLFFSVSFCISSSSLCLSLSTHTSAIVTCQ